MVHSYRDAVHHKLALLALVAGMGETSDTEADLAGKFIAAIEEIWESEESH